MREELPIDPPEEVTYGYDWQGYELYGYEEGFVIDGEFVPIEDAGEYLTMVYGLNSSADSF